MFEACVLNLFKLHFPITAIISILHRISGVLIFLGLPFWLYALSYSFQSAENFEAIVQFIHTPVGFILAWLSLLSVCWHVLAGVRHLIMDLGWGESLESARFSAWLLFALFGLFSALLGVWLWR